MKKKMYVFYHYEQYILCRTNSSIISSLGEDNCKRTGIKMCVCVRERKRERERERGGGGGGGGGIFNGLIGGFHKPRPP